VVEKAHTFIDKHIHPQWLSEKAHTAVDTGDTKARQAVDKIARAYLNARPVYRVKDDVKGLVIKTSVTSIEVKSWPDGKDGNLIIHASILRLTATMLLWGLFFGAALFIAARLMLRPGVGLGLMRPTSRPRFLARADEVIEWRIST
jgi:hypothetical protein